MKKILVVLALMLFGFTPVAPVPSYSFLSGVVSFGMGFQEDLWAKSRLANDVYIRIDSPGGMMLEGMKIVDMIEALKAEGKTVHCYVNGMAMSAAYFIWSACSKRYASPYSALMFHSPRIFVRGAALTPQLTEPLSEDLKRSSELVMEMLIKNMPTADLKWLKKHYDEETIWYALQLDKELPGYLEVTMDFSKVGGFFIPPV